MDYTGQRGIFAKCYRGAGYENNEDGNYIERQQENRGVVMHDVWTDINFIAPTSSERTGYPTQKPVELYRRIIQASSNPDDVILDYRPSRDYSNLFFASNLDDLVVNSGSDLGIRYIE